MAEASPRTLKPQSARETAVRTLLAGGDQAALDAALRSSELTNRDRALLAQLVYGTLKRKRSLDWALARLVKRPLADLAPALLWTLRVGAYQILFLEKVPVHSAVDETVKVARRLGHVGWVSLANAVLRKLSAQPQRPPMPQPGDIEGFADFASLPNWMARHLVERFGFERALRVADGVNAPPRRAARVNTRVTSVEEVSSALQRVGIDSLPSRYGIAECLVLPAVPPSGAPIVQRLIRSGRLTMQSEESQLAVHLLDPRPGQTVLDVGAGRGVKTGGIAQRNPRRVYALDDDPQKLALLQYEMVRLGEEIVETIRADGTQAYEAGPSSGFDVVLIDAPCSGIGTIGRRSDVRWVKQDQDPVRLGPLAARMLEEAARHVKAGGSLLYVTCSTDAREDEDVVYRFLSSQGGWRSQALQIQGPAAAWIAVGDFVLTVPGLDGADGFFYALLRRGVHDAGDRAGDGGDSQARERAPV